MLDPQHYTHLVSEVTVADMDGLTLVTLPRPSGDLAYFRWRWASPPVTDPQSAKALEGALNEAVRGRMAVVAAPATRGTVKFQVLIDAVVATGRCAPAGLTGLLSALASAVAGTLGAQPLAVPGAVSPAEQARRYVQAGTAGLLPPAPSSEPEQWLAASGQAHGPGISTLCIVGDFDAHALEASHPVLHQSSSPAVQVEGMGPKKSPRPALTVLDAPDSRMADVVMGQQMPARGAPLGPAADLALTALAGAHRSDLNVTLREEHRLTYGVQSSVAALAGASTYVLWYSAPAGQAQQALALTRTAIESLRERGVSAERLADLQSLRTGALVVSLDTSEGLCACLASLHLPGSQPDLIEYLRSYQSVSADDLRAALDAFFDPDRMHVAVATNRHNALDWRTHG
ncbi:M16 family metallopeptidase [Streptomyces sp. NPDC102259]|uniref:M16 family metallopeptidase n=1 Tax=Streptomyces sp. NPDC102259 TaxID=3366148 RepID=UPI00382EBEC8